MSSTPILDDFDLNYSEIIKGRLENRTSLPVGLGVAQKGYSVYYNGKVWIWDGSQWNTWESLSWTHEDDDTVDSMNPRTESTPFNATSVFFTSLNWNISISEGYSDDQARTLGTMHFIGGDTAISDWLPFKGRRLLYTAKDGSWFNIKNMSTEVLPANHKQIETRSDSDIFEVVKAEFSYSHNTDTWLLISFERKQTSSGTPIDISEELKQLICCKRHVFFELISSIKGERLFLGYFPKGLKIKGDPCYYYKVIIEGEWSAEPMDNDEGYDYHGKPLFCQFLTRQNEQMPWNYTRSTKYVWHTGNTIVFNEEFSFASDSDLFVGCSYSEEQYSPGSPVYPIQNFERFWIRMTIYKCPKTGWFKRYDIPPSLLDNNSTKIGGIPNTAMEGLPFDGFYEIDIYVEVVEYEADGLTRKNIDSPDMLEIYAPGDSWRVIDKSGHYQSMYSPAPYGKWMNNSLQGSAIVYVQSEDCSSRLIWYRVTLPNGSFKQLIGGYLHARYLGGLEGINCKGLIIKA